MPVGKRFDFQLAGKGYMLQRGQFKGRAWSRTGRADTPGQRASADAKYGVLPDELDHPEVWDDWSGGAFHPYRRSGENTYHWGENMDARFPRQLVHCQIPMTVQSAGIYFPEHHCIEHFLDVPPQPTAPPYAGGILLIANTASQALPAIYYPTGSTNLPLYRTSLTLATTILGYRPAIFGSQYFIGDLNGSGFLSYAFDTTQSWNSSVKSMGFVVAGNTLWRCIGNQKRRPTRIRGITDQAGTGSENAWSATLNIGDGFLPILDMVALDDQLAIGMPDGLYIGDQSGSFFNVLGNLRSQIHEDNCRDLAIHDNSVIVPHISGIFEYRPGMEAQVREVGPVRGQRSPVRGRFRCVRSNGPWLYAGLYTGSQSYLLVGDIRKAEPIWHILNRFPHTTKIHRIHVDGITAASSGVKVPNRMWIATDASIDTLGTAPVYWWPIPQANDNPLGEPGPFSANYVGSARLDMGNVDWGSPGTPKVFRAVEIWADKLVSGYQYGDIYYDVDQSGSFTLLGRGQTSPKSTLYFSAVEGSFITGQSIELSLRSFTASPAYTPIYRAVVLRGALQPRSIDEITAVVQIADNLPTRDGAYIGRSGATMLKELRDLGNPDANGLQAHQLIDLAGATSWVKVLGRVEEQEVYQQGMDNPEIAATVKLAVLTFS